MKANEIEDQESKLENLQDAKMSYPTWENIKDKIKIEEGLLKGCVSDVDFSKIDKTFLNNNFGDKFLNDSHKEFLVGVNLQNSKYKIVGIDVPVLLTPQKNSNGKTIVIVGESPLRDTKIKDNQNILLLGTPYAVDCKYGVPSQCNVYKKIINDLLGKGYSVYLTDIIKVWWKGKKLKVSEDDKKLFSSEMKAIGREDTSKIGKDIFIVAWGNTAQGIFEKSKGIIENNTPVIKLLHPSKQNWNNWKLHILEKAIYDKKISSYALNYYLNKDSIATEDLVANEAVAEILENVDSNSIKWKELEINEEKSNLLINIPLN